MWNVGHFVQASMCDFEVYYRYLLFCTIFVIVQSVQVQDMDK